MMNYIFTCPNIFFFLLKEKSKIKNNARVKKEVSKNKKDEIILISNTTKLSYVLVKGRVNENKNTEDLMTRHYEHEKTEREKERERESIWYLLCKRIEIIIESPVDKYGFDDENYNNLPVAPWGKLSETKWDNLMWETVCKIYKDTEAS